MKDVRLKIELSNISVNNGDISESVLNSIHKNGIVSIDIETSGLDWRLDSIATCQVCIPSSEVSIVRIAEEPPKRLMAVINDPNITKIFHHAMFDLRFMSYKWSVHPNNIACTKIASKILFPKKKKHSLQILLQTFLNVEIDKKQQTSNWFAQNLSKDQLEYAVSDVIYLPGLLEVLLNRLQKSNKENLYANSVGYVPTRVALDLMGAGDVFIY